MAGCEIILHLLRRELCWLNHCHTGGFRALIQTVLDTGTEDICIVK